MYYFVIGTIIKCVTQLHIFLCIGPTNGGGNILPIIVSVVVVVIIVVVVLLIIIAVIVWYQFCIKDEG